MSVIVRLKMKPSPLGSKLLSGYAILFAGAAPTALAVFGLIHGASSFLLGNLLLGLAILYFGVRVFAGDYSAAKIFATLVMLHYLGVTATNLRNINEFPAGSRAEQMAIPRMLRGILFAAIYAWYYLFRSRTVAGFGTVDRDN